MRSEKELGYARSQFSQIYNMQAQVHKQGQLATMINLAILQLIQGLEMEIATSSSTEAWAESQTGSNTQEAGTQPFPSRMNVYTHPKTSTKG